MITYHEIGKLENGNVLLELSQADFDALVNLLTKPESTTENGRFLLDVPWLSQQGNRLRLDCGPACLAMAMSWLKTEAFSVDRVAREMGKENVYTLASDFINLCRSYKVNFQFYGRWDASSEPLKTPVIRRELVQNRLIVALVAYDKINPAASFDGGHWVLLTGFDNTGVYFHDPYLTRDGGHIYMKDAAFEAALIVPGNQPNQGLAVWK